ncbi:MAG: PilT/PilU family type 4a pilus ATPase, partial [Myxococcota bacterium]
LLFVLFGKAQFEQYEEEDEPLEPAEREVVGFDVLFFREASPVQDDDEDDRLGSSPQPQAVGQEMSSPEAPSPVVGGYTPHVGPMVPLHTPLRSEDARVSPALAELLQRAVERGASDLHLCTGEWPTLRIDGRLIPLEHRGELQLETVLEGCLMPSVKARLDMGSSADMSLDVPDVGRFRLNIYRSHRGLAAALRVLPERAPSLESLDLPMRLHDLVEQPHGLIIVTGPTGSGKSSTLAALTEHALASRSILAITLEDPIEFSLRPKARGALVRQREVGRHVLDFKTGLRDALREDPDILMVGEMRDPETISLALTGAETGHLVLTTMHSRSAAYAVERIVDSYAPERQSQVRVQLADALEAVVAQRLVPSASGRGRVAVLEVMRVTHNVASMIREGKTAQLSTAIQSGAADGMMPLERSLANMVRHGRITRTDALAVANDQQVLRTYLGR